MKKVINKPRTSPLLKNYNLILYIIGSLVLVLIIAYIYKNLGYTHNLIESFNTTDNNTATATDVMMTDVMMTDTEYIDIQELMNNKSKHNSYLYIGYLEILDFIITKNLILHLQNDKSLINLSNEQKAFLKTVEFADIPRLHVSHNKTNINKLTVFFHPSYYIKSDALLELNNNRVKRNRNPYPRVIVTNIEKTKRLEQLLHTHKLFNKLLIENTYEELIRIFISRNRNHENVTNNTILNYQEYINYNILTINDNVDIPNTDMNAPDIPNTEDYMLDDIIEYTENTFIWQPYLSFDNKFDTINNPSTRDTINTFSNLLNKQFDLIIKESDKIDLMNLDKEITDHTAISFLVNNTQLNISIEPDRITNLTTSFINPNKLDLSFRLKPASIPDGITYEQLINICKKSLKHNSKSKTLTYYVLKNNLQIVEVVWYY